MLKQQVTSCSSFIPTDNLTMPWGKSVYSHCQLPFSWTELIKVLSFFRYYPILSPFFVFHTSCFIDDSDLYPILSLSSHCTFFFLYDVFHYIQGYKGREILFRSGGLGHRLQENLY
jgi:hypothetical protein